MLDYTMRKKIFEMYFIQGVPIKKITKELEISRNTVRRNISEFNKELEKIKLIKDKAVYDQKIIELLEPKKVKRIRKPKAISLEQLNFINQQLKLNNQKIINKKHKYLLSGEDIYDILVDKHDYKGSVQTVRYHIRKMVTRKKEVFIKTEFIPADKAEFDWGSLDLLINGIKYQYKLAVFSLPYSNYRFAYIYHNEKMSAFVDAHAKFFKQIKGVPVRVVYDNMRVAVKEFTQKGKENIPTKTLVEMSNFYNYDYVFCNEYSPNEKGSVERSVEVIRRKAFGKKDEFNSLEEAQEYLAECLAKLNSKNDNEKITTEIDNLKDFVSEFTWTETSVVKVDKYSTVCVNTNHYSVPEECQGKKLFIKKSAEYLHIYNENKLVCTHKLMYTKNDWKMELEHYEKTFTRKGKGLANSVALAKDEKVKSIFDDHFSQNHKDFILILKLVNYTGFDKLSQIIMKLSESKTPINYATVSQMYEYDITVESDDHEIVKQTNENVKEFDKLGENYEQITT